MGLKLLSRQKKHQNRLASEMNKTIISAGLIPSVPTIPFRTTSPDIVFDANNNRTAATGAVRKSIRICILGTRLVEIEVIWAVASKYLIPRTTASGTGTRNGNATRASVATYYTQLDTANRLRGNALVTRKKTRVTIWSAAIATDERMLNAGGNSASQAPERESKVTT